MRILLCLLIALLLDAGCSANFAAFDSETQVRQSSKGVGIDPNGDKGASNGCQIDPLG
jgi:hypothetical protein